MWPHSLFGTRYVALALAFVGFCRTGRAEPSYEELCQQGRKHLLAAEYAEAGVVGCVKASFVSNATSENIPRAGR